MKWTERHLQALDSFEVTIHDPAACSDDSCPCSDTSILRGHGYIYISKDAAEFRRDARSISAIQKKLNAIESQMGSSVVFMWHPETYNAVICCEQAANLRGLDKDVAAADARLAWNEGRVPCRATPLADEATRLARDYELSVARIIDELAAEANNVSRTFIQQHFMHEYVVQSACDVLKSKTPLAIQDGKAHDSGFCPPGATVEDCPYLLSVSVIPSPIDPGFNYYEREHGGYLEFLEWYIGTRGKPLGDHLVPKFDAFMHVVVGLELSGPGEDKRILSVSGTGCFFPVTIDNALPVWPRHILSPNDIARLNSLP